MAVAGLMTPSMAEPITGSSKVKASISQEMSTSSGSRVRRLGTMAMSSNPYARRPDLPMPISTSATALPLFWDPVGPLVRGPVVPVSGPVKRSAYPAETSQRAGTPAEARVPVVRSAGGAGRPTHG